MIHGTVWMNLKKICSVKEEKCKRPYILYDSIYVKFWRRQNDRDRSKFSPSNWGLGEWYGYKKAA